MADQVWVGTLRVARNVRVIPDVLAQIMTTDQAQNPDKFPLNERAFLDTLAKLLRARGVPAAAEMLERGRPIISQDSYDNWNGGTYGWGVTMKVPVEAYAKLEPNTGGGRLKATLEVIKKAANELMAEYPNDFIGSVIVAPIVAADLREVSGVNNQGRAHSDNVAGILADGLRFRSQPEVNLYRALRRAGVTFAPLPVFLAGQRRIEPDFVILKDGVAMVVEIDGPATHPEAPVAAEQRLSMFRLEGVRTERVTADSCSTEEKARATAAELLQRLARYKQLR